MRHLITGLTALNLAMASGVAAVGFTAASAATGSASAVGSRSVKADFNRDGFADLAVGVHGESRGRGAVNVVYGSGRGLAAAGNQYWTQDSPGIKGKAAADDHFGFTLAVADFDGNGFADLAVGVPGESRGRGAVNVIYGSARGLTAAGNQYWTQDSPGIRDKAENGDHVGWALAAGSLDGDIYAELAVGAYGENAGRGAVNVLNGSSRRGLVAAGNQYWTQDSPGIRGKAESGDHFGSALAGGEFTGGFFADLAVGVPGESHGRGAVNVIRGEARGLTAAGNQYWTQDSPSIRDKAENGDQFGSALAVANFRSVIGSWERSPTVDLAIGAPGEDGTKDEPADGRGAVNVLYGSARGLTAAGNQYWTQDSPGITGKAQDGDHFGSALVAANFGKSAHADLAIGVHGDHGWGGVNVIYGSARGLTAAGNQSWTQDTPGINGKAGGDDRFGAELGAGDFNGKGFADLAVGAPGDNGFRGSVNVIYGSARRLTTAGNQYWTQDSPGIKGRAEFGDYFGLALSTGP